MTDVAQMTILAPDPVYAAQLDAYAVSGSSPPRLRDAVANSPSQGRSPYPEPLLTTRQLAALWSQSQRWVLRMVAEQGLPAFRLGTALRYRVSEAEEWLEMHRATGGHTGRDRGMP